MSPDPLVPLEADFLFEASPDGMLLVDRSGVIRAANSEANRLFGYDVGTYKTTPDWLNADHWANPELWNKHRW